MGPSPISHLLSPPLTSLPHSAERIPPDLPLDPPQPISWIKGEMLGRGAFGNVYRGLTSTAEFIAVKEVTLLSSTKEASQALEQLQREITLMQNLQHPHILRYLGSELVDGSSTSGASFQQRTLNIFLEYAPGGSIHDLLQKFGPFQIKVVSVFTTQILDGLIYLHENGIVHRDIKGANVLLDSNGKVKLADFGASKQLSSVHSISNGGCNTFTGSPYWMAPEVIQAASSYGTKADAWSVGAICLEMITGKPPFGDLEPMNALFKIGQGNTVPDIPDFVPPEARDFMQQCFTRNPDQRPSCRQLRLHSFVNRTQIEPKVFSSSGRTFRFENASSDFKNKGMSI